MSPSRLIPAEALRARRLSRFPYPALAHLPAREGPPEADPEEELPPEVRVAQRLRDAERQAELLARQAQEQGFQRGEAEGRAAGEAQHREALARLDAGLRDLGEVTGRLREAMDDELVALTLAVGERLALQHLSQTPDAIRALLRATLEALPFPLPRGRREGDAPLQVFLHPQDLARIDAPPLPGLSLTADAALSPGDLRLESPLGVFDASLERRRQRIMDALREAP